MNKDYYLSYIRYITVINIIEFISIVGGFPINVDLQEINIVNFEIRCRKLRHFKSPYIYVIDCGSYTVGTGFMLNEEFEYVPIGYIDIEKDTIDQWVSNQIHLYKLKKLIGK